MFLLALSACITELPVFSDPCAEFPDPDVYKLTLDDGRSALVELPDTVGPRPMVMMLHGYTGTGAKMRDVTRYGVVGAEEGFVSVFPNGYGTGLQTNRSWNAGDCCPPAIYADSDDVGFLDRLVTTLEERVCADPERTYVSGFSNGAMMSLRMACQSQTVDGVFAAAGPLVTETCDTRPVPVMLAHGLEDRVVEFEGGVSPDGRLTYQSSDDTLAVFLARNNCQPDPRRVEVGRAMCEEYTCDVPVRRCTIPGWNHRWPGGMFTEAAGFNATRQSWDFFDGVPLAAP
ncbi:MAG: PHB depolymerase family esterase [Myxococcota bacterium]